MTNIHHTEPMPDASSSSDDEAEADFAGNALDGDAAKTAAAANRAAKDEREANLRKMMDVDDDEGLSFLVTFVPSSFLSFPFLSLSFPLRFPNSSYQSRQLTRPTQKNRQHLPTMPPPLPSKSTIPSPYLYPNRHQPRQSPMAAVAVVAA